MEFIKTLLLSLEIVFMSYLTHVNTIYKVNKEEKKSWKY